MAVAEPAHAPPNAAGAALPGVDMASPPHIACRKADTALDRQRPQAAADEPASRQPSSQTASVGTPGQSNAHEIPLFRKYCLQFVKVEAYDSNIGVIVHLHLSTPPNEPSPLP
ncbi:hypothetical protein [Nevskia sp.]|uniref:hypothetical protein n=1 Tax=Nevskia sp. TaxID=1929292 RepID=UPI0025EF0B3C|nr:hypothetical protein [Nevskia sp.]